MSKLFHHIALEGLDGSGKGTQVDLLAQELRRATCSRVVTKAQPAPFSEAGALIRRGLQEPSLLSDAEMNILFAADRVVQRCHLEEEFSTPTATDGQFPGKPIVVYDRSVWSSYAYHGVDSDMHKYLSPVSTAPDFCVYIDVSPQTAMERISKGRSNHDRFENLERLTRARENYLRLAQEKDSIIVVDGEKSTYEVAASVFKITYSWLKAND